MIDVGIDQATLSTGQTLLQLGVVLFEIPSNVVLYRIGPRVWITFQIFAWYETELYHADPVRADANFGYQGHGCDFSVFSKWPIPIPGNKIPSRVCPPRWVK